jgi:hypothetical protein
MHGYFRRFEILKRFFIGNEIIFKVNTRFFGRGRASAGPDLKLFFPGNRAPFQGSWPKHWPPPRMKFTVAVCEPPLRETFTVNVHGQKFGPPVDENVPAVVKGMEPAAFYAPRDGA